MNQAGASNSGAGNNNVGAGKVQQASSRVKSVDKVAGSGLSNLQSTKANKQNYIAIPRSPEPLQNNTKGGSMTVAGHEQVHDGAYMKDSMNISTPLHYPSHQQKQQMRINSERIESMNPDNKPMSVQGSNQFTGIVKQQVNLGQQQYTLNLDLQSKTQGYNFRAKKKSFDKQKFAVKSQEGHKPGQVSVNQSLNRASEQRHSINDNIVSRQVTGVTNNNQYGDIMILPNIQQVPAQNQPHSLPQSKDQNSRQNHVGQTDNKAGGSLLHQGGANRHKQSSINRSQQVELGGKLSQYNQQLQQRSINGTLTNTIIQGGVPVDGSSGNPGIIYENQQNHQTFIDASGNLQQIGTSHGHINSHDFGISDVQSRSFGNSQATSMVNIGKDRGKSIGIMQTTGSRFKVNVGEGPSEANINQYNLHLKDNLHTSGGQSPEYLSIQELNRQKQAKISKYASNVDLKPQQGFNSHLTQVPMTTVNSQIINDNSLDMQAQNQITRAIQGHNQNRSHVIASRQMGKRMVGQSLNGRTDMNDLRIGQQQIMPTVKSNRDNNNNHHQSKQVADLQRMQSRQRAQKQQFQTQSGSREQSNHDIKVASVHNSFSAYRNGLQIKSEANWQSNRSQEKNSGSTVGSSQQPNTTSLRHQEQRKRARFHQQHYGGSNAIINSQQNDNEHLILNTRHPSDKHGSSPNMPLTTTNNSVSNSNSNQFYSDVQHHQQHTQQRSDSLEAVNNSQEQQNIRNSRNNQRRIIMHSQGQMNHQMSQQTVLSSGQVQYSSTLYANIPNPSYVCICSVNRVSLAKINSQQSNDPSSSGPSPPGLQPQVPHNQHYNSQKNNFVSSTRNNNYKNDVSQYIDKLRQSGEGFNRSVDKKGERKGAAQGQGRRGEASREQNDTPPLGSNNQSSSQQQSKMKHQQNLTMDQLDVSEIHKDKKKQNIHKTINIFDSANKGAHVQQKDIRVKYFNNGVQQQQPGQINQRRNNSRAESGDSNRSKSDNQQQNHGQQHYNGKFLKQFQTQENKMYIQAPNTHKNQHRQSAGQILKPLKDAKIHSEHQSTKFNLNPYTDNPANSIAGVSYEHDGSSNLQQQEQPGKNITEEPSKTPMVVRQGQLTDQQMYLPPSNSIPEKRNRSYTRGRKSGVRNQQISQTLQSSQQATGNLEVQLGVIDAQNQHQSPKITGTLSRQNQHQQQQQFLSQSYLKNKVQSQPDLPTIPLPLHSSKNANQKSDLEQKNDSQIATNQQSGVVNPVKKSSPVPAVTNNNNNNSKPEEAQRAKSYGKEVSPRKNTGITVGPGAAVGLGMPGLTQPYQLLKYSAISRCGMVLKQIMTTSGDQKNQQTKLQQILTPKINQDSFKVIKSFPEGTKPFNWLFGVFDGHGPHGEVMSQYAADAMPIILNNTFKKISLNFMPQIQSHQQDLLRLQSQKPSGAENIVTTSQGGDLAASQQTEEGQSSQQIQQEIINLNSKIKYLQQQRDEQIDHCLKDAFDQVDCDMRLKYGQGPILQENIKQEKPFEMYENDLVHLSGCTGTTILVQEDFFVVANCGDSPVFIFREEQVLSSPQHQTNSHSNKKDRHSQHANAQKFEDKFIGEQLSVNHKPDMPEESERINKIGGVLDQFESQVTGKKVGPMRVWSKHTRQPGLAMSRSLGDNLAKSCGVIAAPTVRVIPRNRQKDRAILVCSDGISDQIQIPEMAETIQFFYKRQQDTENCCKQLVEFATQKWHTKHNMQDDITCIVMFLR